MSSCGGTFPASSLSTACTKGCGFELSSRTGLLQNLFGNLGHSCELKVVEEHLLQARPMDEEPGAM